MNNYCLAAQAFITDFIYEDTTYSGVRKIADKVITDLYKICGNMARNICYSSSEITAPCVIYGSLGKSKLIDELASAGKIDITEIKNKKEVYVFFFVDNPLNNIPWSLVIVGSDKRGTIYGLFHLSELLNVSPYVNWSNVIPQKRNEIIFTIDDNYISKEPSVEYRGFFINDEWPAFGTWCNKRFGGFNARMYDGIFEVLLRLKGNYLWPAMWASCFAEEGPGLANAELADEYGVVMGLSHHEPCLRHGEEYSHLRGKDSIYGDAWNFRTNPEGIRRFWRDGLKRNGHLENVITIGMRGERDSAIMGDDSTLEDNINLLRDVIKNQHQLIKEEVNDDLKKVPRMLALYKEVEPYFYGDSTTKGLIADKELEDVIFLLCDDNHGYLRSRPYGKMLEHKGGYGMYYHFDYHGDPVSYEWVNSTYLPCVWEQMSQAYETGIRKLWIVNEGDLAFQEFPLNYFMDLAYDYDKYGINHPNETRQYTAEWIKNTFGDTFDENNQRLLEEVITEYTHINHNRRPEHLNDSIYSVVSHSEAMIMHEKAKTVMNNCQKLMDICRDEQKPAFYELIYYNAIASMNLLCMWIYRGYNHFFAGKAALVANDYGKAMLECISRDEKLKNEFNCLLDGKWCGLAEARHIGFENWNSEESHMPVLETVIPVNDDRIVVGVCGTDKTTTGEEWTRKKLVLNDFTEYGTNKAYIYLALASKAEIEYTIKCDAEWLMLSKNTGILNEENNLAIIEVVYDTSATVNTDTTIHVCYASANAEILVKAPRSLPKDLNAFTENNGVICMEAEHYSNISDNASGKIIVLDALAKTCSAVKALPINEDYSVNENIWLEYSFYTEQGGEYTLSFELETANPSKFGKTISLSYTLNDSDVITIDVLENNYMPGESKQWAKEVMNHVRCVKTDISLNKGINKIRFYETCNENVLERIILTRKDCVADNSYLGPKESFKA